MKTYWTLIVNKQCSKPDFKTKSTTIKYTNTFDKMIFFFRVKFIYAFLKIQCIERFITDLF